MRPSEKVSRLLLGIVGLTGDEYPGAGRDVALAIPLTFAACVLLVYSSETHPSVRLKYAAIISLVVMVGGLLLAKSRAVVISVIAGFIGLRGVIALTLNGLWQGLLLILGALLLIVVCRRWLPD
jgi:hypothetical protein